MLAAMEFPNRIRNLVLLNPAGMIGKDSTLKLMLRFRQHLKETPREAGKQGTLEQLNRVGAEITRAIDEDRLSAVREISSIGTADIAHLLPILKQEGHKIAIIHTTDDLVFPMMQMNKNISAQKEVNGYDDITKIIDGFYSVEGMHNQFYLHPEKFMYVVSHALTALEKKTDAESHEGTPQVAEVMAPNSETGIPQGKKMDREPEMALPPSHTERPKETIDAIKEHVGQLTDRLLQGKGHEGISGLFRLTDKQWENVPAQDRADIETFARYAFRQLGEALIDSPYHKKFLEGQGLEAALNKAVPESLIGHDLIHAMVAYNRSSGETVRPLYTTLYEEGAGDPAAVSEELMAFIWTPFYSVIHDLMACGDATKLFETFPEKYRYSDASREEYLAHFRELEPLRQTNPLEYYLSAYETHYVLSEFERPYEQSWMRTQLAQQRDPTYVEVVGHLLENARSENPDPLILLHECQRILSPLLTELREKGPDHVSLAEIPYTAPRAIEMEETPHPAMQDVSSEYVVATESETGPVKTYVSTSPETRNVWESFGKRRYFSNPKNRPFMPDRPMNQFEQDYFERREREKRAGFLERKFAPSTRQTVVDGKNNPDKYESFTMSKMEMTKDDVIWICFPGLGAAYDESEERKILGTQTMAEKMKAAAAQFLGVPGVLDSLPQEGTVYKFNGPAGIAGYTPEQCIRCTKAVKKAVDHAIAQHPTAQVKFFSYSGGTHLGFYMANQYGKERAAQNKRADGFVAIAAGTNIGYGMYSTWVVEPLAQDLEKRGITKEQYFELIRQYTQIENLEYLPKGEKCLMFAGTHDSFIPIDMEGGTNDLVKAMDKAGLSPIYTVYEGKDHASLLAKIIIQMQRGENPYRLGEKINAWENPGTLQDQTYMGMADRFLNNFSDEQLRGVGEILAGRNGKKGVGPYESQTTLKPYERAVVKLLIARGICAFQTKTSIAQGEWRGEPVVLTVIGKNEASEKGFLARRKERILNDRNLAQVAVYLQELGRSEDIGAFDSKLGSKVA